MANQTVTQTQTFDPVTEYYRRLLLGSAAGAAGLPGYGTTGTPTMADFDAWRAQQMAQGVKFGDPKAVAYGYQQFLNEWNQRKAGEAANPPVASITGPDPQTQAAIDALTGYTGAGQLGLKALTGDASAFGNFMNPYQSNVLDTIRNQYGLLNSQAQQGINDAATRAGAFGGSRQAVASGVASGDIARGLGEQISGLQYQGFNDAMNRAYNTANLGFGAIGPSAALGQYAQGLTDPNLRGLTLLGRGFGGVPYGTSTTMTQPINQNPWGGVVGGATAGSAFGPWGAAIGGGLGWLLGGH